MSKSGATLVNCRFGAGVQIDAPEIFVLNLSSQKQESRLPGRKTRWRSPTTQGQGWHGTVGGCFGGFWG